MKFLQKIYEKTRAFFGNRGYTCDACGEEIFTYPQNRLCTDCLSKLACPKRVCQKCGRETITDGVCLDCKKIPPKFTKGISPFVYRGRCASLVNRMKNGAPHLAYFFGEEMANAFAKTFPVERKGEKLLILPVPLTEKRVQERGYNQAKLLAEVVQKELEKQGFLVELRTDILIKRKDTEMQKHMRFDERIENVSGAYHITKRTDCKGGTLLLIDDIMTTGATGTVCAQRLLGAGAKEIYFLVATALSERK